MASHAVGRGGRQPPTSLWFSQEFFKAIFTSHQREAIKHHSLSLSLYPTVSIFKDGLPRNSRLHSLSFFLVFSEFLFLRLFLSCDSHVIMYQQKTFLCLKNILCIVDLHGLKEAVCGGFYFLELSFSVSLSTNNSLIHPQIRERWWRLG